MDPCARPDALRRGPFVLATFAALALAAVAVEALPGASDRDPRIRAVRAKADAFVSDASRAQNFGRTRALLADAAPTVRAYVLFKTDLTSAEVRHVSLLLYSRKRSRIGYQVRLVQSSWRESRINYENAPRPSPRFVASGPLRARAWKAVDVTSLVRGAESGVSFALTTVSTKGVEFASRETGLRGPRLVVEWEKNETTTATTAREPETP